jgi:hypothetical protein
VSPVCCRVEEFKSSVSRRRRNWLLEEVGIQGVLELLEVFGLVSET